MEVRGDMGVVAVMDLGKDGGDIGELAFPAGAFVRDLVLVLREARAVESTQPS